MTKKELSDALTLAQSKDFEGLKEDMSKFDGFGYHDFQPITCTIRQLAALIRWQCSCLDGSIDASALNEIASCKRKFQVV